MHMGVITTLWDLMIDLDDWAMSVDTVFPRSFHILGVKIELKAHISLTIVKMGV